MKTAGINTTCDLKHFKVFAWLASYVWKSIQNGNSNHTNFCNWDAVSNLSVETQKYLYIIQTYRYSSNDNLLKMACFCNFSSGKWYGFDEVKN